MLKNFFLKQVLKSQLKGIPVNQQEQLLKIVSENPEFFQSVACEIDAKVKEGKNQTTAALEVMQARQEEFSHVMKGFGPAA